MTKQVTEILEKRLSGQKLTEREAVTLIRASDISPFDEKIISAASQLERPRKNEVFVLPPLYISSSCVNACTYCNFHGKGKSLSLNEFEDEFRWLVDSGHRSIELVFGQDPKMFVPETNFDGKDQRYDVTKVAEYFQKAKQILDQNGGGMLTINAPAVDELSYHKLKNAGLDVMLLWQETFNPMRYQKLHPGNTPKSFQDYRLNVYDRARNAGMEHIAGTFLKGLYDWRVEEQMLCHLDRDLYERQGRGFSMIGTPRIKNFEKYHVSDEDYILNIALDLLIYSGPLWLQTRESWELNSKIYDQFGGGFIQTIDTSTAPGGYAKLGKGKAQFPVHPYQRNVIEKSLMQKGINTVYSWNVQDLSSIQRV
jgi:2-iminoacetate synthase